ncbi:MAG: peptide deformylase [Spirochaetota bacterium]
MAVRRIFWYGADILRTPCSDIKKVDEHTLSLVKDMFETMQTADGVGLAANQVGAGDRLVVIRIPENERRKGQSLTMVNPVIKARSEETVADEEGCLSVPGVRAEVTRPKLVTVEYYDLDGKLYRVEADGLLARVMQHEIDHIDGTVFVERIPNEIKRELTLELRRIKREEKNRIL